MCQRTKVLLVTLNKVMTKVSRQLKEACELTIQWVLRKLNAGDGLSCLLFVIDGDDRKTSIYIRDTVTDAIRLAHDDLTSHYQNVTIYVIAYDGSWFYSSGIEHRSIIAEAEERASARPRRLVFCLHEPVGQGQPLTFTNEVIEFQPPDWSLFTVLK